MVPQALSLAAWMAAGLLLVGTGVGLAADQQRSGQQAQLQTQEQEQIYGSQLMTPEQRAEYRARMGAAASDAEREKIRREHHEQMKERARNQGIILPDEPPGQGMGGGRGAGGGMGPGGGMGGGRR